MPVASIAGTWRMRRMNTFGGRAISDMTSFSLSAAPKKKGAVHFIDLDILWDLASTDYTLSLPHLGDLIRIVGSVAVAYFARDSFDLRDLGHPFHEQERRGDHADLHCDSEIDE